MQDENSAMLMVTDDSDGCARIPEATLPLQESAPVRIALAAAEPLTPEEARFARPPVPLRDRMGLALLFLAVRLLWAWHLPLIVAEERAHRGTRAIGWLTWLGPVLPPLWLAALLWALLGPAQPRSFPCPAPRG